MSGLTLNYQNLLVSRVPINSTLGFIIKTYKKVGFGSLRLRGCGFRVFRVYPTYNMECSSPKREASFV